MLRDDLSREVYCVLGVPIDAVDMPAVLDIIKFATENRRRLLISTTNLNFLSISWRSAEFRESLLVSDLCPVDGTPILWLARFMGLPITKRTAGSDIFEELRSDSHSWPLKVFLFGGEAGVAATACAKINSAQRGLACVGSLFPGFGSVEELCQDQYINEINQSGADFLVASLGAEKGQLWLLRNRSKLIVPVLAHLGATIGYQADAICRAPRLIRKFGFEWAWRIKEEPKLWARYWHDGWFFLRLLFTHVLPIVVAAQYLNARPRHFAITHEGSHEEIVIQITGSAVAQNVREVISCFRCALEKEKRIVIDFSGTQSVDSRFLGLLLMLRKELRKRGNEWRLIGVGPMLRRLFCLHGLSFLIEQDT